MIAGEQPWGAPEQAECEECGRSLISRFGGVADSECPSCADGFQLLVDAQKIAAEDWTMYVVKYTGEPRNR